MAEEVGFEPTVGCPTTVFKTAAIGHSATLPWVVILLEVDYFLRSKKIGGLKFQGRDRVAGTQQPYKGGF
jgi:hypothetical protein